MSITPDDFKACLGSFPTGVTIVTTSDGEQPYGLTINAFSSLSLEPPLILFNLNKSSFYHDVFTKSTHFVINILSQEQQELSHRFAHLQEDRWDQVSYNMNSDQCPLLEGALAHIQCQRHHIYDGGDHSIITGEVKQIAREENLSPLLYFQGKYHTLGSPLLENEEKQ